MTCLKPEGTLPGETGAGGGDFNAYGAMQPRSPSEAPKDKRNGASVKANDVAPGGAGGQFRTLRWLFALRLSLFRMECRRRAAPATAPQQSRGMSEEH